MLNHGAFGACPKVVLDAQNRLRAPMESDPVRFFLRQMEPILDGSRQALAGLVGSEAADLVFVRNATAGVNSVLRSLRWKPGDELLLTNHAYNACRNAADYVADRTRVKANASRYQTWTAAMVEAALAELEALFERLMAEADAAHASLTMNSSGDSPPDRDCPEATKLPPPLDKQPHRYVCRPNKSTGPKRRHGTRPVRCVGPIVC